MKVKPFQLCVALLCLLAGGCATYDDFVEGRRGLTPVDMKPDFFWTKASVEPNEAILIIGDAGEYHGGSFEGDLGLFSITIIAPASPSSSRAPARVYALPFKVGETFRLTGVKYFGGGDLGVPERSPNKVQYWKAGTPNAKPLKFSKPGIYYYGTVVTKDKKVGFTDQFPAELKRLAREKFPYIYTHLAEVPYP